jgi:hypothetical protein
MDIEVPERDYAAIEALISSSESPVGIDAKKTHVLVLHLLLQLERRLRGLEEALGRVESKAGGDSSRGA